MVNVHFAEKVSQGSPKRHFNTSIHGILVASSHLQGLYRFPPASPAILVKQILLIFLRFINLFRYGDDRLPLGTQPA